MFSKKSNNVASSKTLTVVAEGVRIDGKIYSKGSTRIDGIFYGEVATEKELVIGRSGEVSAIIQTNNAVIAGNFKGNMIASGEVEIASTGRFTGNLTQKDALLTIEKGGLFKGESIISDDKDMFAFPDQESFGFSNPLERRKENVPREPDRRAVPRSNRVSNERIEPKKTVISTPED